ncbi:VCBS repeat-containing protein [Marinilongibacter aquaticus]|uniref:VCBS repeat-containing protein n=1 Tax=Marinilongibacter aquaticus TaxID=2975157 RepID=UPI0021BD9330|nr:VCBS repeat-containing protein [Marinilongibacter aquaticus]UBM59147.1 VCBS repeat-containing protein [Marinilongibacter aquaticus]
MRQYSIWGILSVLFFLTACATKSENEPLFKLHKAEDTGIHFSNTLYPSTELNIINFEYFYNGAGVAIGDINNDGLQDIYFSGNMVPGKLYLNQGNFRFEDITAEAGIDTEGLWGTGVSMVDINSDGLLDLYLCFAGPYGPKQRKNRLYVNEGNLKFSEQAGAYGLDDDAHTTQAAFFDYDRDGDLDVYLLNNITGKLGPNVIRPKYTKGEMANTDKLLKNENGHFVDVSAEAGILKEGYGLGLAIADIDQDGWPDIYVSNDYLSNDLFYRNKGDATFEDTAARAFKHTSYSSMGCDIGDYNNDGLLDIVAVDMLPPDQERRMQMIASVNQPRFFSELEYGYAPQFMRNTLQLNQGTLNEKLLPFSELGYLAGIESTDWSWSPLFADIDNDGFKDLLITNGYPRDITNLDFATYKADKLLNRPAFDRNGMFELIQELENIDGAYLPNYAFKNLGNLQFSNTSESWGFVQNTFSHGAAVADLDNDGDLDYVVNNSYDEAFVYENTLEAHSEHNYLRLSLNGPSGNTLGWGTKVTLFQGRDSQFQEFQTSRGYQSSVEPIMHFGLGGKNVDSVVVEWPDQSRQYLYKPQSDQLLRIEYKPERKVEERDLNVNEGLFEEVFLVDFLHQDNVFDDFSMLSTLPHAYSQEGPALCVGDVDGNGLDDFFIGGAKGQTGRIYMQEKNGRFESHELPSGKDSEDVDAEFFDVDQDGDLDLYVCSGSAEFLSHDAALADRLYINDGQGHFSDQSNYLPHILRNSNTVRSGDFDRDGDMDLFVGLGVDIGNYGHGEGLLLENRNGHFVDVTAEKAPELKSLGIVTDADWQDFDGDGFFDLWICGEWMPISVFRNEGGRLKNRTEEVGLKHTLGWWNTLAFSDMDKDGDVDIVAGNLGLNSPYRSSDEQPLALQRADFDQNGSEDFLISHYLMGKQVPLHFRNDFLQSLAPFQNTYADYQSYAQSSWKEILPEGLKPQSTAVNTFSSVWLENKEGKFTVHELPLLAQTAPVQGILLADFDADGLEDILLSGNSYAQNPFVGYLDAMQGLWLRGNAAKEFQPIMARNSGFALRGDGRGIVALKHTASGEKLILVAQNNGALQVFSCKK